MCVWEAISRIRPVITERVASVNLQQYLSTALSMMTGLIQDIAMWDGGWGGVGWFGWVGVGGVFISQAAVNRFYCIYDDHRRVVG
jgi:hypothetical protein